MNRIRREHPRFDSFFLSAALTGGSKMMKHIITVAAVFLLSAAPALGMPSVSRCRQAPVIDGKLDDPCWKTSLKLDKFHPRGKGKIDFTTTVRITYDEKNLYFGFECGAPAGKKAVVADITRKGGRVFMDDSVEIMVDPFRTGDRYYHFIVNANGVVYDAVRAQGGIVADGSWNSETVAASKIHGTAWNSEVKIPFHSLELQGRGNVWSFNITRNIFRPDRLASIIPGGVYHSAGHFIPVNGFRIGQDRFAWKILSPRISPGKMVRDRLRFSANAQLSNPTASEQEKIVSFVLIPENGGMIAAAEKTVKFKANEIRTIDFRDLESDGVGKCRVFLSVRDPQFRHLHNRREFSHTLNTAPLEILLLAPWYRNMIFATQDLKEVVLELKTILDPDPARQYHIGIRTPDGKVIVPEKKVKTGQIRFAAQSLPEGKMEIFARAVKNGKTVASAVHPLRKLPYRKGEVWLDKDGFWRRDGKRIWIIAEWGDRSTRGLNASFNRIPGLLYIDPVHAWGYPEQILAMQKKNELTDADKALLRKHTRNHASNPNLFAFFLVDEPDFRGVAPDQMIRICNEIRDEDPYHPIVYNTCSAGLKYYNTGEINGLHLYPKVDKKRKRIDFSKVAEVLRTIRSYNRTHRGAPSIAYFTPGYNNGDCGSVNCRIYTFDETRTENLMAVIMGGRASMFYVWTGIQYPELYIGNTEFIREIKALEKVLLTNDFKAEKLSSGNPQIEMMVKKVGKEYWIFAVSMVRGKQTPKFRIPGLGSRKLQVFREGRTVHSSGDCFTDREFNNFDVRIYTTDTRDFGLKTLAEVEKEIEAVHARQKKPGNLAYQRYEQDTLQLSASSNRFMCRNIPESNLWHITDGVTSGLPAARNHGYPGVIVWKDKTPKQLPDWIELKFKKTVKVGRAVVYPALKSLKDYEIQAWLNGKWKTVGRVKNAAGKSQTVTFPQVSSDRFRLWITKNNGPDSALYELELYEK